MTVDCSVMAARSEFTQVLEKCSPDAAPAGGKAALHMATGRALLGLERAAEAKPLFEAALAAEPNNLDALLGMASATYALEGLSAAKAVMEQASPDIQKKVAYWMAMGGISAEGGDPAGAELAYQKALDKVEKGADGGRRLLALGALAESQMRQGKVKEATATAEQLSKAAPDNPLVKQLRGQERPRAATSTRHGRCSKMPSRDARQFPGAAAARHRNHATGQPRPGRDALPGRACQGTQQRPRAETADRGTLKIPDAGAGARGVKPSLETPTPTPPCSPWRVA